MTTVKSAPQCPNNPFKLAPPEKLRKLAGQDVHLNMTPPCKEDLHFGFFFDGTRNNADNDRPRSAQSNVARLFDLFDVEIREIELKRYRFRSYVAGVGSPFYQAIGDLGIGIQAVAGAAAGWGGEARINWALLQMHNHLHAHYHDVPLTDRFGDRDLVKQMSADISAPEIQIPNLGSTATIESQLNGKYRAKGEFDRDLRARVGTLASLTAVARTNWREVNTKGRRGVLNERKTALAKALGNLPRDRKPIIKRIHLHVFGFSRGAAQARVFCNWLRDACDANGEKLSLCGIPVQVDFLGLFDTVASAGIAQSMMETMVTGHGAWAQKRWLRIPGPDLVKRCVHLVSSHEVRGSFPLDSAHGSNVEEFVYPGVHSDVGGGYEPGEQGRGCGDDGKPDDSTKLSQIPLAHMYREAVIAGVPLMSPASAQAELRKQFRVHPELITAFNAYRDATISSTAPTTTPELIRNHYGYFLRWRHLHLGKVASMPSVQRAPANDRMDLVKADAELAEELKWVQRYVHYENPVPDWISGHYTDWLIKGAKWIAEAVASTGASVVSAVAGQVTSPAVHAAVPEAPGGPIAWLPPSGAVQGATVFSQGKRAIRIKFDSWKDVKQAWENKDVSPAIDVLFSRYVHDSRAWFKPLGDDDDVWYRKQQDKFDAVAAKAARKESAPVMIGPMTAKVWVLPPPPLSDKEQAMLETHARLKRQRQAKGQSVDAALKDLAYTSQLPQQPSGRELWPMWGYLRWRTVYDDKYMDYRANFPQLAGLDASALKRRMKELEPQLKLTRSRSEALNRTLSSSARYGSVSQDLYNDLAGQFRLAQAIEEEMAAITAFMEERAD
ncbi:T6SS phospholipase effector Tle1-like catalytic domain-containing protein [Cupriavidus nantongensis]|uniref:T6SS Phospholipase effector Tle1-like catalytic domain-containing protein n=1 Tax=Cupriavidus nantongensis TaxID=1796606 RepID=A0A142JEI0_9BURK|nr:DUF2235 domain-containing protein [Cupriavidus nantongensis]AMR76492.1 hypothetical protein A2G96_01335 [Cupriavidus nantongensis]